VTDVVADPRALLVHRLRGMRWIEEELAGNVLPRLRARVHAVGLAQLLDKHLLETETHVTNVKLVLHGVADAVPAGVESPAFRGLVDEDARAVAALADGDRRLLDLATLDSVGRTEHLEVAAYQGLVQLAQAVGAEHELVLLLRENMEQDAYAAEEGEHVLAKLLAEGVESRQA
jgi:ferritin-like metal-binding protein YciE